MQNSLIAPFVAASIAVAPSGAIAKNGVAPLPPLPLPSVTWNIDYIRSQGVDTKLLTTGSLHVRVPAEKPFRAKGNCPKGYKPDSLATEASSGLEIDLNAGLRYPLPTDNPESFTIESTAPAIPGTLKAAGIICDKIGSSGTDIVKETLLITAGEKLPPNPTKDQQVRLDIQAALGGTVQSPSSEHLSPDDNTFGSFRADLDLLARKGHLNTHSALATLNYQATLLSQQPIATLDRRIEVVDTPRQCLGAGAGYAERLTHWLHSRVAGTLNICWRDQQQTGPSRNVPGGTSFVWEHQAGLEAGTKNFRARLGVIVGIGSGEGEPVVTAGLGLSGVIGTNINPFKTH